MASSETSDPALPCSQNISLLQKLPAEVRIIIWKLCLQNEVYFFARRLNAGQSAFNPAIYNEGDQCVVLRLCKQIYEEIRPFYGSTVSVRFPNGKTLGRFLRLNNGLIPKAEVRHIILATKQFNTKVLGDFIRALPRLTTLRIDRGEIYPTKTTVRWTDREWRTVENGEAGVGVRAAVENCTTPWTEVRDLAQQVQEVNDERTARAEANDAALQARLEIVCNLQYYENYRRETDLVILPAEKLILWSYADVTLWTKFSFEEDVTGRVSVVLEESKREERDSIATAAWLRREKKYLGKDWECRCPNPEPLQRDSSLNCYRHTVYPEGFWSRPSD